MSRKYLFPLLFLLVVSLACKALSGVPPTATVESILTPTLQPTLPEAVTPSGSASQQGSVLLKDDFSDPNSGWITTDLGSIALGYANGEYRVIVKEPYIPSFSAFPKLQFEDVSIEADAHFVRGTNTSLFGLFCRLTADPDLQSGYQMLIDPGGDTSIVKITGVNAGEQKVLTQARSNLIKPGFAINHLRMDCSGSRIATYVNGQPLLQAEDTDYSNGRVGFGFGTNNNPGFEVRFDNFNVKQATP